MLGAGRDQSLTPVVIGDRASCSSPVSLARHGSTAASEYTHGYGIVMSPANSSGSAGQPNFAVAGVPVSSVDGAERVTQPDIYFGDSSSNYVVVDIETGRARLREQDGRHPEHEPLRRYRWSAAVRFLAESCLCHALSRLQPSRLEPHHPEVPDHLPAEHRTAGPARQLRSSRSTHTPTRSWRAGRSTGWWTATRRATTTPTPRMPPRRCSRREADFKASTTT